MSGCHNRSVGSKLQNDRNLINITYKSVIRSILIIIFHEKRLVMRYQRAVIRIFSILALSLCIFVLICCPAAGSGDSSKPEAAIAKFNSTLVEAMKKADALGYHGRYKLLDPVIKEVFALQFMGSKALGRHWKKLSAAQQDLYIKTYITWTIATYAGKFDGYSGEKFEISGSSKVDDKTVAVMSSILKPDGKSIVDFKYLMRSISGKWQIVDIRIMEVSQLALTRSDFVSVINKKGFDSLISSLKGKTAAFATKSQGKK
jgi:phospholipid transport system substrate-binding protein